MKTNKPNLSAMKLLMVIVFGIMFISPVLAWDDSWSTNLLNVFSAEGTDAGFFNDTLEHDDGVITGMVQGSPGKLDYSIMSDDAYTLGASTEYIEFGSQIVGVSYDKTIMAWVNVPSITDSVPRHIIAESLSSSGWQFSINNGELIYSHAGSSSSTSSGCGITPNTWHLVGYNTSSSAEITFFCDGELVSTHSQSVTSGASNTLIGARRSSSAPLIRTNFNGSIDELYIWSDGTPALSLISGIYNFGFGCKYNESCYTGGLSINGTWPSAYLNISNNTFSFLGISSDDFDNVKNVTLFVDDIDYGQDAEFIGELPDNEGGDWYPNVTFRDWNYFQDYVSYTQFSTGSNNVKLTQFIDDNATISLNLSTMINNATTYIWFSNGTFFDSHYETIGAWGKVYNATFTAPSGDYVFNTKAVSGTDYSGWSWNWEGINETFSVGGAWSGDKIMPPFYFNFGNISSSLADGEHTWYVRAFDNDSNRAYSENITFYMDATNPSVNIVYPSSTTYTDNFASEDNKTIYINWTASDTNLDMCWYYNGTHNVTVTCNTNATLYLPYGTYTFYAFANDTFGNINSDSVTGVWNYRVLQNDLDYNAVTHETFTEGFTLNISLAAGVTLSSAMFWYNGTAYASTIASNGTIRILTNTIIIPAVSETFNSTFYWTLNTNVGNFNTSFYNQTINELGLDSCTVNDHLILNYTIYDEDTRAFLNASYWNTSANLYVRISGDYSGEEYEYYSGTITNNSVLVCLNDSLVTGENYRLDAEIQFKADDYVTEYYYIENYTLNTSVSPKNISLYLLDVLSSQEFLITYKDSNLIPVEGALIELSRQYLEIGSFLTVEISKTDSDGRTVSHFVLNDEIYTVYVKKDGELLATFENVRAFCDDVVTGDCKIYLNELSSTTNPSSFNTNLGVIGSEDYDDTTKTYTFTFTTTDSVSKTVNLTIYKFNVTTHEAICSEQVTSSSGTLSCTIPAAYYNSTGQVIILVDGEEYTNYLFPISISRSSELNPTRWVLAFILVITLPLIAIGSAPVMMIFFIIGLILAGVLAAIDWGGFIGPFSAFLWFVIAAIVLAVRASKRRQQY